MDDSESVARKLFGNYGITIGRRVLDWGETHVQFNDGSECHAIKFENGRIHFHIGTQQWKEHLPADAPHIRIREMQFNANPVGESEWFPC